MFYAEKSFLILYTGPNDCYKNQKIQKGEVILKFNFVL